VARAQARRRRQGPKPVLPKPVLIVESRFYPEIADDLARGAGAALDKAGVPYERLAVPGVFEIPAAIRLVARSRRGHSFGGYIALGCVIRGETDHYDHICREASRALMDISLHDGLAVGFGILTCPTADHARVRAAPNQKNKGAEAARACLALMALKSSL
jgi:6,7-dimethyl-8-ribityllumazine synthase